MKTRSRAPRAPVEFVVARHLITHPDESPSMIATHCDLHIQSVSRVLKRFQAKGIWRQQQLQALLREVSVRAPRKALHFRVADPDLFLKTLRKAGSAFWLSGEYAAALDGFDLVPEHCLVYIRPVDFQAGIDAAMSILGKVTSKSQANVEIRLADPWLYLEEGSDVVERGQRILDYESSQHLQILKGIHG